MKRKLLVLLGTSCLSLGAVAVAALSFVNSKEAIKADPEEFSITLNADDITDETSFSSHNFLASTDQLHNSVKFKLGSAKRNGDYVEFAGQNNGFIGNHEDSAIYAMKSVDIFFKADNPAYTTRVEWGWKNAGVVSYPYNSNIYAYDDTGYHFNFEDDLPDYFRIVNDDEENDSLFIKKLVITYGDECKSASGYGNPYRSINKLKYKRLVDHWAVVGFANPSDTVADLVFESEIEGLPVTEIGGHAFYFDSDVETVTFTGSNITKVGRYSFYCAPSLTSVDFSSSNVTEIDECAFTSASLLANVEGLENIEVFNDNCLAGTAITSVTFGDNLRALNGTPFYDTDTITSVTFSDLCEPDYIGSGAFNWSQGIETVHIGSKMTQIPDFYMSPIKTYSVGPDPVYFKVDSDGVLYSKHSASTYYLKRIPMGTELTEYVMPDYVDYCLGDVAENCTSLQSVTINNAIYSIGSEAFAGCTNLETVIFEAGSDVHYINNEAFLGCTKLATIELPSCVTNIGNDVFKNCTALTSFTIPHDITSMGCAFAGCSNIAAIYYAGTVEEWNTRPIYKYTGWFDGISATVLTCTDGTIPIEDAD